MRRKASFMAALAVVALALAPALAEARVGGRSSMGSRGARTYQAPPPTQTAPSQVRPMDRTMTEPARPGAAQQAAPRPGAAGTSAAGGFFSRSPLMAGLMGGLLGAGLFGLLSGHGLFGGLAGFAGFLGLLLQIALIAGLVWLVMRLVRGGMGGQQRPALAGAGASPGPRGGAMGYARDMGQGAAAHRSGSAARGVGAAGAAAAAPVELAKADFDAFERTLIDVQAAWTRQDLEALRRMSTPEMTNYFAQDLSDLRARGWRNEARDVRFEQGDLAEAWREGDQEYATVAMRFSLFDVTIREADGAVVEGDPERRETATELWTFVRRPGGAWLLSAIQQTN